MWTAMERRSHCALRDVAGFTLGGFVLPEVLVGVVDAGVLVEAGDAAWRARGDPGHEGGLLVGCQALGAVPGNVP